MRARVTTIVGVIVMSALLLLYMWAAGFQAWLMITTGDPLIVVMGLALIIFPLIGVWALARELMFGIRSSRLGQRLSDEGDIALTDLPTRPSGRPDRSAADAVFPEFAAAVESAPDDWRAWFRLGLAYDASGDRRRARGAIRRAIALSD
jgi:hypothetical protein